MSSRNGEALRKGCAFFYVEGHSKMCLMEIRVPFSFRFFVFSLASRVFLC